MASTLTPGAEDFERARRWRGKPFLGEHRKRHAFCPVSWAKRRKRARVGDRRWLLRKGYAREDAWQIRTITGQGHATGCLYCGTPWQKDCPEPLTF